jgi:hypothetical protein
MIVAGQHVEDVAEEQPVVVAGEDAVVNGLKLRGPKSLRGAGGAHAMASL